MTAISIPMPREQLARIVRQVVRERLAAGPEATSAPYKPNLVVNVSARHLHITQDDLASLFGPAAELTVYRWLYQPGEFAAEQTVTVLGPRRRMIQNVHRPGGRAGAEARRDPGRAPRAHDAGGCGFLRLPGWSVRSAAGGVELRCGL